MAVQDAPERSFGGTEVGAAAVILEPGQNASPPGRQLHLDGHVADQPRTVGAHRDQVDQPHAWELVVAELIGAAEQLITPAHGQYHRAPVGRRVDESNPMVDARLSDGSRVNAIIPPLAVDGPLLSIRRFGTDKLALEGWEQYWASGPPAPLDQAGEAVSCIEGACLLRPRPDRAAALLARGAEHPPWCGEVVLIVSAEPARGLCPRPWPRLIDRFTVWRRGAQAIWLEPDGVRIYSDLDDRGARPWVPVPVPSHRQPEPSLSSRKSSRTSSTATREPDEPSAPVADLPGEP